MSVCIYIYTHTCIYIYPVHVSCVCVYVYVCVCVYTGSRELLTQGEMQVINGAAPSLSTPFQDSMLDWYKDLYGVQERSARPRKCFSATTGGVSWASAKV